MYKIRKLDEQAVENAEKKWNSIAKPLHSLGVFGSYGGCDGKLRKGCNKRVCYGKKYRCGRCTD